MRSFITSLLIIFCGLLLGCHSKKNQRSFPLGAEEIIQPNHTDINQNELEKIAPVVKHSIAQGYYPGAVIYAGHQGQIIYRGVFGSRSIVPTPAPMTFNTVFDLASLTKVVATTPAVMQLIEKGQLNLNTRVASLWPAFGKQGKNKITIGELLKHTSGLPAGLSSDDGLTAMPDLTAKKNIFHQVENLSLHHAPGTHYEYSDVNFIVLAHVVEIVSGERFDHYVEKNIFSRVGMHHTVYRPQGELRKNVAPTEIMHHQLRFGEVQDPLAFSMGGVAGNAGLFSTAYDLGLYAETLLNRNQNSKPLLQWNTIKKMTTAELLPPDHVARGLGWEMEPAVKNENITLPQGSFGHTGWTGTSLWIDPETKTWVVILTSRTHPTPAHHNQIMEDRRKIAKIIALSVRDKIPT